MVIAAGFGMELKHQVAKTDHEITTVILVEIAAGEAFAFNFVILETVALVIDADLTMMVHLVVVGIIMKDAVTTTIQVTKIKKYVMISAITETVDLVIGVVLAMKFKSNQVQPYNT